MIETICGIGMICTWLIITNEVVVAMFIQDIYNVFHKGNKNDGQNEKIN